jgi:hypothetical protein
MGACFDGFFFCNGPFDWPITKKLWNPLSLQKRYIVLHLHYFTQPHKIIYVYLFYTYIVLYSCIKPYKCIDFYTYTYMECKFQTIYTQH